jgi:uncharacterized protein (DUF4213/DUF364 family)
MKILNAILETLPEGEVLEVRIGLHWTAVVVRVDGEVRCGLASTLAPPHRHVREPDVKEAGHLETIPGKELAALALGEKLVEAGVGLAAINALLPRRPELWREDNAEEVIARFGKGKRVAMVGRFPFVPTLRERVGELKVLEQNPGPEDLPTEMAPEVLPEAEVVAITGMTLANHTLEGLMRLCAPEAKLLVLGPTTPLSPVLFEAGVEVLSGAVVQEVEPVLRRVSQGANFHQVHQAGVRLVNMHREEWG